MSDYTRRQIEAGNRRLLRLATYLREQAKPQDFDMGTYANGCGSPACVLGHYAAMPRTPFRLAGVGTNALSDRNGSPLPLGFSSRLVRDHFALTNIEARELFDSDGCGGAKTPKQAARYLERFVARRHASQEQTP